MNAESLIWQGRRHAAVRTDAYLYHQLIPYLGNKRKLLPLIRQAIEHTGVIAGTFVDYFAGSGVVSRLAKLLGYRVLANDWEPYARAINRAYIGSNRPPRFAGLGGLDAAFAHLNALPPVEGYIARHLCPRDDHAYDPSRERLFYTRANGGRIDAIREQIAAWEDRAQITEEERDYLLAALLYGACYVSNTSGVFKGFHRGWGGATGTAHYRILSQLRLTPPLTRDNGQENPVTALDARELAANLDRFVPRCDIAYLDPPYNQHPYGANYHVLNTIALWDQPPVSPWITGQGDKSAIRKDWRTARRSAYNYRADALPALEQLLGTLESRYILISYSTDGLIPLEDLVAACCRRGRTDVVARAYKRYRVSSQRYSPEGYNVEFVLVVDGESAAAPAAGAAELLATIEGARVGGNQ
ncbi:MAG TPA: DNA adenine methylase [Chloroflexota bacterium]|nr:DNA adenine methylase [Chloroflexota bacterium]